MNKTFEAIGTIIIAIGMIFYRLFVSQKAWGYIAVHMFNMAPITMWQAFAINSLIHIFTANFNEKSSQKKWEELQKELLITFVALSSSWFFSWLLFA